jgi:anaerobic selenocysteine-containing dehydrogenase
VKEAFQKLDLLVVADIFMTDTAEMADVVLPGTTFLERQETRGYLDHSADALFIVTNQVIEPVGNAMDDWKIWTELGRRMGYAEHFPWQETDELIEYLLSTTGLDFEELKKRPAGIHYAEQEFQKYLKSGFNTPSGKVELYSETLAGLGYDPLPTFHEPVESPLSRPELVAEYPLILITGARARAYLHSEYRNLPSLRRLVPEPLAEIHPQTAGNLGIADGDLVEVVSLRGSIRLKARLTEDIHPQVVSVQHGWSGEANVNLLTDDEARDPISGYPGFRSVMCRLTKT